MKLLILARETILGIIIIFKEMMKKVDDSVTDCKIRRENKVLGERA